MKRILWTLAVIAMAALSCTKQENEKEVTFLKINSASVEQTGDEPTKAAIKETSFPTDKEVSIGLFVVGDGYTDAKYCNIKCTKPAGSNKFTDPQIELIQGKTATVYAYYPYDENIKTFDDLKAIPVASSVCGNDWMWATPITEVSTAKSAIDLKLNHALALVEITFNISGPEGTMTNVTVAGGDNVFSAAGTMDATTGGALTPGTAVTTKSPFSQDINLQMSEGKIVADCLLVPCKTGTDADVRQDFYIKCTYNGKTYSASLTGSEKGVIVRRNTKSTIVLNIKDSESKMEVESVGIAPWSDTNVAGNTAKAGDYTVTFNCPEGLRYDISTESISTIIPEETTQAGDVKKVILSYDRTSVPESNYVLIGSVSGCSVSHDELNGVITVKDITDNATVDLKYGICMYIRYTATSRVVPYNCDAFGFPYDDDRSTFSAGSGAIAIDGIVTNIGDQAFYNIARLTGITLPEDLESIGNSAFDGCNKLTDINLEDCSKLKTIGVQSFYGAGSKSESGAFSLVLPEGLESIGGSAFNSAKISSVTLPSTLTAIGNNGFYNCLNLASITSKASVPPTLGEYAFYYINSSYERFPLASIEAIYVPEASVTAYKNADGWKEFSDKIMAIPAQD